jgi:dipeptidyl aminopeptidase/acylaminoacyl peptidase
MRDRLQACGAEVQLITFEGAGHGFKGEDANRAEQALIEFFEKHLK